MFYEEGIALGMFKSHTVRFVRKYLLNVSIHLFVNLKWSFFPILSIANLLEEQSQT